MFIHPDGRSLLLPQNKYTTHTERDIDEQVPLGACVYAEPLSVSMAAVRMHFNYLLADFIGEIILPSSP